MRYIGFIFAMLLVCCASAAPRGATRVLRTFDFEERSLGNAEDLPMHWVKVEGQGLPHYVNARLSSDRARSGSYSFRFDLDGGGLIYRLPAGQIAVSPGGHYRVEAYVQTTVLAHAKARLTAYFTDLDRHVLPQSIRHSEPYAATAEDQGWKRLGIELSADDQNTAFLVLELELLQPSQYAASTLGNRMIFEQDIRGSAWFDDVTVLQAPSVAMSTDRPGNVFRRSDPLRINVAVRDLFVADLSAQVIVKDAGGSQVYQHSAAMEGSGGTSPPGCKSFVLALPDLPPGWYEASLAMSSGGQVVGGESIDLVMLPDDAPPLVPDQRFGINATALPQAGWDELPALLPMLSAGRVKLALWSKASDMRQMDGDSFDRLLMKLSDLGIAPTGCLLNLPPSVAAKLPNGSWPAILDSDPALWRPSLLYLVARLGTHLDRWQLGADGSDEYVTDPRMRQVYQTVYREFSNLMSRPDLAMPWPAWYELQGELPATVAMSIPTFILPSELPLYMQDINKHQGHDLSLSLQLLDRDKYGRLAQIKDLAQRVVYALSAGATRIDLPLPFRITQEGDQIVKQPSEMLLVMRTLTSALAGAEYKGKVPLAEDVEAFLFDRDGEGILVLWGKGSVDGVKTLAINLGRRPMSIDLWGNVTPLRARKIGKSSGKLELSVSHMPTFLIDIDGVQAQLRASLSIDRPLVESSFEPHARRIRFVNPGKTQIAGTMKITAPPGWTINPPTFVFSLNPGEKFDREFSVSFPYNSFAGKKTLDCTFAMQDAESSSFSVPLTMTLGLSDVGMQTIAIRNGADVIVQQTVTNYGEKAVDYNAFAVLVGQARQERLVSNLTPGNTVVARYRFTDASGALDAHVRVGIKELQGVRVLNDEVPVQ